MKNALLRWYLLFAALIIATGSERADAQCFQQWLYRLPVTVNNTGATITNYYLLVQLNTQVLISGGKMRSDGGDIRFSDAACNPLNYWVESGLNTVTTNIWVKVPTAAAGNNQIYMYYGNPSAASTSSLSNIFGNGVVALYTFTEGSGTTLFDRSGNGFNMTLSGLTWGSGIRNSVRSLTGFASGGRAFYNGQGPAIGTGGYTAIAFININNNTGQTQSIIGSYPGDSFQGWLLKLQGTGSSTVMNLTMQPTASPSFCQTPAVGSIPLNTWTMVSGTRQSGTTKSVYVNGTKAGDMCAGDNRNVTNTGPFEIGRGYTNTNPIQGGISFAAVYNVAVSDAAVQELYKGLAPSPEPSVTLGAEQLQAPVITQHPASAIICEGGPVTFNVQAQGSGLTYQWRRNGFDIPAAVNPSYTIPVVGSGNLGSYDVVVRNQFGTGTTSQAASLSMLPVTRITANPGNLNLCRGSWGSMICLATGSNLTYQWRKNGEPIEGQNGPELRIYANMWSVGNYDVVVKGDCGTMISQSATIGVQLDPIVMEQPLDQTTVIGNRVTFGVKTMGGGILTYQWQKDGRDIPNATSSSYTIQSVKYSDIGDYNVVIRGTTCSSELTVSNKASLLIGETGSIIGEPESSTACLDQPASFSISATGTDLRYQWRHNGAPIYGANSRIYDIPHVSHGDVGSYDVVVRNFDGQTLISKTATLSLFDSPKVTQSPADYIACQGKPVKLSAGAEGSNLSYQWRHNGVPIDGATGSSYEIASMNDGNVGEYDVVVTNACGDQAVSEAAQLEMNTGPAITAQPGDRTVVRGESVIYTVNATGQGLHYQWRKNGLDIPGATSATYQFVVSSSAEDGLYDVVITDECGNTISSTPAQLSVSTSSAPLFDDATTGSTMLTVMPNPARGSTKMAITLPRGVQAHSGASLVLFDTRGRQVLDLSDAFAQGNFASVEFNASVLPSGTYYCRLVTPEWNGTLGSVVVEK